jgi:hypothetical protein
MTPSTLGRQETAVHAPEPDWPQGYRNQQSASIISIPYRRDLARAVVVFAGIAHPNGYPVHGSDEGRSGVREIGEERC